MREFEALAITGIPGSGKTELAGRLSAEFGWPVFSLGDIARQIDPESLAAGQLADEAKLRAAFLKTYYGTDWPGPVIIDGLPRNPKQASLVPPGALTLGLTCREDIAIGRQILRARDGDTTEIIIARTEDQAAMLEQNVADGFIYQYCGFGRVVNTSQKRPEEVAAGVAAFLRGDKREVF